MSSVAGGLNVFATQKKIFDYLRGELPWDVIDAEVPDAGTVIMKNGVIEPYVVMRFSDILPASGQNSFGGVRNDGYYSLFQAICVADTGMNALELSSMCNDRLIGYVPDSNSGPIYKQFGGGSMAIKGVNSNPSFTVAISAYANLVNLQTLGN